MKNVINIKTLFFVILFIYSANTSMAQLFVDSDPVRTFMESLDEEGKEYYAYFQTPYEERSIDEQIRFWKLALLSFHGMYVEEGEIKTKVTEKDFVELGFKPFFHKYYLRQLKEMTDMAKTRGEGYEEMLIETVREMKERQGPEAVKTLEHIKELEARKKEMETMGEN